MDSNVYMHSITNDYFHSRKELKRLDLILNSKALLSLRNRGISESSGFAGLDYVSLADYSRRNIVNGNKPYYNAYFGYIRRGISFAFNKDVINRDYDVEIPTLLDVIYTKGKNYYRYMCDLGNEKERFSDLPDEVQVKDYILLKDMSYVTYPCNEFFESRLFIKQENKRKKLIEDIKSIRSLLIDYGYNLDIYDIDSQILLDEDGIEKILTKKN